jgi:hypothetical protein
MRAVPEPERPDVSDRRPVLRQALETALRPCCGRTSNGDSALGRVEVDVGRTAAGWHVVKGWLGWSAIAPRSDASDVSATHLSRGNGGNPAPRLIALRYRLSDVER